MTVPGAPKQHSDGSWVIVGPSICTSCCPRPSRRRRFAIVLISRKVHVKHVAPTDSSSCTAANAVFLLWYWTLPPPTIFYLLVQYSNAPPRLRTSKHVLLVFLLFAIRQLGTAKDPHVKTATATTGARHSPRCPTFPHFEELRVSSSKCEIAERAHSCSCCTTRFLSFWSLELSSADCMEI